MKMKRKFGVALISLAMLIGCSTQTESIESVENKVKVEEVEAKKEKKEKEYINDESLIKGFGQAAKENLSDSEYVYDMDERLLMIGIYLDSQSAYQYRAYPTVAKKYRESVDELATTIKLCLDDAGFNPDWRVCISIEDPDFNNLYFTVNGYEVDLND